MKKKTKWKITAAAIAMAGCISAAGNAMAFNQSYSYAIGPNDKEMIAYFVPGSSKIYLNTRPQNGGGLKVILSGAASASLSFPQAVAIPDCEVPVPRPSSYLTVTGEAQSTGVSGSLRIWSK